MSVTPEQIEEAVGNALEKFYKRRIGRLKKLSLDHLLKRKNPYLFKGKGVTVAAEVVQELVLAYMSSSEETLFGNIFFEEVALAASGGEKAPADSVDIVIHTDKSVKAIAVKSGTSVFNAQSKRRQQQAFEELRKRMAGYLASCGKYYDPIVGYAYGKKSQSLKSQVNFREVAGQAFWEEITGDPGFYLKIARLMKDKPREHAREYREVYGAAINRLTRDFTDRFCDESGFIDWDKWIEFNSGK